MLLGKLFISFLKIGAFGFGGGYAMLPLIQEEIIHTRGWLLPQEFIDILAVAEMTPGPIAINSATFLGFKTAGTVGAVTATFAVVLPSFLVMSFFFYFVSKFKDAPFVEWIFEGIRPIVLGLIVAAAVTVGKGTFTSAPSGIINMGLVDIWSKVGEGTFINVPSVLIAASIFYLVTFKKLNPILSLVFAATMGILFY